MPPMSPRTQAMTQSGVPSDQAKTLFDQGFSQMAYGVLVNKLPNITPDVVTFKVLDTDHEGGSGVGAFVVLRRGQTLYIPVVIADNQIKPLDILYYKDLNVFLPLTKEWLEEVDKLSLGELGEGVKAPETLQTDVDIRNTVVPPTTGRYSYASARNVNVSDAVRQAGDLMKAAREQEDSKPFLLNFLEKAPNRVKTAFAKMLETRPTLLKQAVAIHGSKALIGALQPTAEKTASLKNKGGALYIADRDTATSDFKNIFGSKAPAAFSDVSMKGYASKDDRKDLRSAMSVQPALDLHEPKTPGAYKLWQADGKPVVALIISNPIDVMKEGATGKRIRPRNLRFTETETSPADPHEGGIHVNRLPGQTGKREDYHAQRYVGITESGELIDASRLVGQPAAMSELEGSKVFKTVLGESAKGPRAGQKGLFLQRKGATFLATAPVTIDSVSEMGDGVKRIVVVGSWGKKTLVQDPKGSGKLMLPADSDVAYLPADFHWLPTKGELVAKDFLTNPMDVFRWATRGVLDAGGEKIKVAHRNGEYLINRDAVFGFVPALRKLASSAHLSVDDAAHALKMAEENGRFEFWALTQGGLQKVSSQLKVAEGESKKKAPPGGEEGDPAQDAMDQVAPAPPPPSPVDLAVAEQMQVLQMQSQALQTQMGMLQTLQQRAQMIAMGGAAASPMGAAASMGGPMDPSMMGAGAPMMPAGGMPTGMPPQQPGMPPSAVPQQGMAPMGQPSMDPAMMQGMDPAMMQGMDPSMQQQPPAAMMNADDGDMDTLMSQVNPEFVESAGQLQDAGAFDAAALASMAQSPSLKDLVGQYLPNLEKSLDNLGRVLLTLWMDEGSIKEDIGNETFIGIEDNLRQVFKGLGDLILKVNQNTLVLRGPNDPIYKE